MKLGSAPKLVEIAQRPLPVSSVLNTFFKWTAERDRIRRKRLAGNPPPWSGNPKFANQKYCHVFRIYDRGTQFVLHDVINKGSQDHREICFRVILFKLFNRITTWELLEKHLGPLTWARFDLAEYERVLDHAAEFSPLYTSAYQIPAPDIVSGPGYKSHLQVLQLMMEQDLPGLLLSRKRMQDAFELIKLYPGMGPFLSYQLLLDLNMTPYLNFPENEWAVCGPGSQECLVQIFGKGVRGIECDAIAYLYRTQAEHYKRLRIADPPAMCPSIPGLSFVDIEHSLCECAKYCNDGNRRKWEASEQPVTADLPAKWLQGAPVTSALDDPMSPLSELEEEDGDTYEISHIVGERLSGSDGQQYRVRWTGYGPGEDTWFSAANLENAPEVLEEWRSRRALQVRLEERIAEIRRVGRCDVELPASRTLRRRSTKS